MAKSDIFQEELSTILDDDIRNFAKVLLDNAPDYFYTTPASTSSKYHPSYALGTGGLIRHTKGGLRFLNHIISIEQHSKLFNERQKDLMRVAFLYHDGDKHGNKGGSHTAFNHPLCAAETVRSYKGKFLIDNEIEFIASCIETHMGEFNKDKRSPNVELPKPKSAAQQLIHLADYLASRKDLEVLFDGYDAPRETFSQKNATVDTYIMPFGKHKGTLLKDIPSDYLDWIKANTEIKEPLKSLLEQL